MSKILGWHFTDGSTLANGDTREIVLGKTLAVKGDIVPCSHGLHASPTALDALQYAPGPVLWRVELSGTVVSHGDPVDKYAASKRKAIAGGIDITSVLREFARSCVLDVIHLWDAPQVVRDYLTAGDESLRVAAGDAARAARAAVLAAENAALAAVWAAAGTAAGAAAWAVQRERFEAMCLAAIGGHDA